jgi:2-polyprenyl-3-methyl-5-hydroxy-6-metoxy-1,4-benzoquinol methylase
MKYDKYLDIISHMEQHYLERYGDSHLGVGWPKLEDVDTRYRVMLEIIKPFKENITLLDFGCGCSHLYEYILKNDITNINYYGLDISEKYIKICKQKYPQNNYYHLDIIDKPDAIPMFDYIIMNGIFTLKYNLSFDEMFNYFKKMMLILFSKINKGIAFNVMAKAVDWERDDLFHLPMDLLADFLTKNLSRKFIIRNDYGLYEYTVYLYKPSV